MPTGGCYCGAVRYEAGGAPFHETICHCRDCRRIAGAQAVAWFTVPRAAFRFVGAEPTRFRSSKGVIRTFCGTCGTALTFESDETPDETDVTLASLDDPEALPPRDHTHVESRLCWVSIDDGRPAYDDPASRP